MTVFLLLSFVILQSVGIQDLLDEARTALQNNQLSQAEAALRKALELDPKRHEAYVELSTLYRRQERLEAALEILRQALGELPQNPMVLYHLGVLHGQKREFDEAVKYLKAIPEKEAPEGYWEALGRTYVSVGDFVEAEKTYLKLLEVQGSSIQALRVLSGIALKQGDAAKAWNYIARARREAPASPQVLYDFAQVSLAHNLVSEAVAAMRLLVLMEAEKPEYFFSLGSALVRSADYREAEQYFSRYLELKPDDPQGHMMYAYSKYLANDYPAAGKHLEKALELDPDLLEAYYYQAMIAYKTGRDEEAAELFQRVLSKSADHALARLGLGKLHLRRRKFREAATQLERAAEITPQDSDVHFQLHRVYTRLGDQDRTQQELELYSKFKQLEEKRERESRRLPFTSPDSP